MGWNQRKLGEELGVTENYVGMLENGRDPGPTLVRLFDLIEAKMTPHSDTPSSPRLAMKEARLKKGYSFAELAKRTRYRADVLQAVEEGQGQASESMIRKIAKALDLDAEEMMAGSDHPVIRDPMGGTYGATPDIDTAPDVGRPRFVPHLSMAQAGAMSGTSFTDGAYEHQGAIAFAPKDSKAFAVTIVGDSMAPNFTEGDVALVYPSFQPRNDSLVICRLGDKSGGDVMFKIFSTRDSGRRVVLTSFNPAYPAKDYTRDEFLWIYPVAAVTKNLMR